jgi:carbonic anhydrase
MLDQLKRNNREWAASKLAKDPGFFKRLEGQQRPDYLWIGCLHPIRELADDHKDELATLTEERGRLNRLCELNVIRQARNVTSDVFIREAWTRGQPLSVHGWVYSLSSGLVTDLNVTVTGPISAA